MKTDEKAIALFIGSSTADNITILLNNLGYMLSDDFALHLITTAPQDLDESVDEYFRVYTDKPQPGIRGGVRTLWSYLQNHDPKAIVQLTLPPTHGLLVGSIARWFDVPSIYRYSGDRFYAYKHISGSDKLTAFLVNNIIGSTALKICDNYIVLGPTGQERLVRHGVDREKITILPPSINHNRINQNNRTPVLDIPKSHNVVLFVGRLHPLKGIKTIEAILPEIVARRDNLHFVFVGEDYGFEVPSSCREHVTVVGRVPPDDVPEYLRLADVLIHPSMTEGLPRVILESLAVGTPVIARDVGEISSVTDNTFTTNSEFIEMICRFEELPLDDVNEFFRTELEEKYTSFFQSIGIND